MSLINVMLMDLEHRNYQHANTVAKRARSIRFKGVKLLALFIGFALGGSALNQTAPTNNLHPMQTTVFKTPQQSKMSVNASPVVDVLTAENEPPTADATTILLPYFIESYPRPENADSTASLLPQFVIKPASFQPAQTPKQPSLEKLINPTQTLSALNEVGSSKTKLQTQTQLQSKANANANNKPKAKPSNTVAQLPRSTNATESDDTASIKVIHRPLSAEQQSQRAIRAATKTYKAGNFSEAERMLENILAQDNAQHKARLLLAKLYAQQNLNDRAELVLSNGLLHYPQHVPYVNLYAQILAQQGRDGDAIDVLQNALPSARDNASLHAMLAGLYQRTGNSIAASKSYLHALELEPKHGEWWIGLGISSEQAGDRNTAESAYNESLQYPLAPAVEQYAVQRLQQLVAKNEASKNQINK